MQTYRLFLYFNRMKMVAEEVYRPMEAEIDVYSLIFGDQLWRLSLNGKTLEQYQTLPYMLEDKFKWYAEIQEYRLKTSLIFMPFKQHLVLWFCSII